MRKFLIPLAALATTAALAGGTLLVAGSSAGATRHADVGVATHSVSRPHRLPIGSVLHAHANSPFATFQWYRCNKHGRRCLAIHGATRSTYRVRRADFGHTLRARIVSPTGTSLSPPTMLVGAASPVNTSPPTLTDDGAGGGTVGDPTAAGAVVISGDVLTGTNGTWKHAVRFTYQWDDCDSTGANCVAIAGATANTYTLQDSDVGHTIVFVVTAFNS